MRRPRDGLVAELLGQRERTLAVGARAFRRTDEEPQEEQGAVRPRENEASTVWDVVGPVCESGDWIGRERALAVRPGDLLAVLSAGAYCMSMASNYNTRGRAAEVLIDGDQAILIRQRESAADQMRLETPLP